MASVQTPSFAHNKIIKPRAKVTVKPILKKIQSAHSGKTSLDLNRSWDEQDPAVACSLLGPDGNNLGRAGSASTFASLRPTGSSLDYGPGSIRDVSFTLGLDDPLAGDGIPTATRATKYTHGRTASGTSHISTGTSNSGRNGHFVHPFQQTPLTSTPPLSHHSFANSQASFDAPPVAPRDYSPTITESDSERPGFHSTNSYFPPTPPVGATRPYHSPVLPHSFSQGDSYRSSMTSSHRTNSVPDITQPVHTTAARASSGVLPRSAQPPVHHSQYGGSFSPTGDSTPSTTAMGSSLATHSSSASTAATPLSPIRSSLDMNGAFRLRSRSEVDTATRQEQVRQARRKFEDKERAKEEKYAREDVRKRDRADTREAQRKTLGRKSGSFSVGVSSARNSMSMDAPPRMSLGQRMNSFGRQPPTEEMRERDTFASRDYSETRRGSVPDARPNDVRFETTRRPKTTKRKTTGTWTAFVLWFRTRLLKMGRR